MLMVQNIFLIFCIICGVSARLYYDLTHTLAENAVKWNMPAAGDKFYYKMTNVVSKKTDTYTVLYNFVEFFEHMGTHFDSPGHYVPGRQMMHEIPAHQLIGPGVIIDVKDKAAANRTYGVAVEDVLDYEQRYGRIPSGAIVIMNSGWHLKYPDKEAVYGTSNLDTKDFFRFPGWSLDAAKFVLTQRHAKVFGVDSPSIDVSTNSAKEVHVFLLGNNIPVLEYAANLDGCPPNGTTIVLGAIKSRGGSGGPVRAVAFMDEETDKTTDASVRLISSTLSLVSLLTTYFIHIH